MSDEIIRLRIPVSVYRKVKKAAEEQDRTIAYILRRAICERFEVVEETKRERR